jgi:hypothetical protein
MSKEDFAIGQEVLIKGKISCSHTGTTYLDYEIVINGQCFLVNETDLLPLPAEPEYSAEEFRRDVENIYYVIAIWTSNYGIESDDVDYQSAKEQVIADYLVGDEVAEEEKSCDNCRFDDGDYCAGLNTDCIEPLFINWQPIQPQPEAVEPIIISRADTTKMAGVKYDDGYVEPYGTLNQHTHPPIQSQIDNINKRLEEIKSKIGKSGDILFRINKLENRLSALENDIGEVDGKLARNLVSVVGRLDALENFVIGSGQKHVKPLEGKKEETVSGN